MPREAVAERRSTKLGDHSIISAVSLSPIDSWRICATWPTLPRNAA